jgi:hypothetical protein
MFLLFVFLRIRLLLISLSKLHREQHFQYEKTGYMVEHRHVIVHGYQIMVNGIF